jgi:hypothetical protein
LLVARVFVGGDENPRVVGDGGCLEPGGDFRQRHDFPFPCGDTVGIDGDLPRWRPRVRQPGGGGGDVERHPLEMGHAQAHQHEGGEQEKHDVDERDDLDPRFIAFVIRMAVEVYGHV